MLTFSLAPGTLPPNTRVYAVGDVHGCARQLQDLHDDIANDLAARPIDTAHLIHLGDHIDRGADSAGVVTQMLAAESTPGVLVTSLMGNHEQMMLSALSEGGGQMERIWRRNGGEHSLRSWGIDPETTPALWAQLLPPAHLSWLRGLAFYRRIGSYFFVHAGVRPGIALVEQTVEDLLWIREPFLTSDHVFEAVVVHGHTPVQQPTVRPNRIGVDTGAVLGGRLTCAVLEGGQVGFLSR
jgi:serine/threonine protein phosphatase 1